MTINNTANAYTTYSTTKQLFSQENSATALSGFNNTTDIVTISDEAKAIAKEQEIKTRLDAIKIKPAVERTREEIEFVNSNDKRLSQISSKDYQTLTAEELDYQQKAGGFVNTMATLTSSEKALYNELVAKGDYEAASGMNLIALSRTGMEGQEVQLPNGQSFNPMNTEITAGNIRNFFQHMFVDPTGEMNRRFEALATYLEQSPTNKQS
ncbi:hypothetical protein Suden_0388 [Sulfurimonas denitrificans DSM 1251]|uniref:Uncharacterized protein n=1 Tax=Sulfurimonas denitrificans (strain ATCC 33889 / DSM 1251) TaxID=326298 RepID=Q30TL2_SULDN|nr:hypothetical protein [Sulfurimonas denitrificans]ABB43669.1 hypothetical protein Suden_0388 [Sulfurimonas denitrificans DSM 1251]